MTEWLQLATTPSIVRRALLVALIVGSILIAINHGDAFLRGDFSVGRLVRVALTVVVPYCVSTYSSVSAIREHRRKQ